MGSQLVAIYDALANLVMSVDGRNVYCRKLEESTGVVNETPVRILSPLSDRNEGRGLTRLSFGNGVSLEWSITELVLLASVMDGTGLEYYTPQMVQYQADFVSQFSELDKTLGIMPKTVIVRSADIEIGVYNYPLSSDNWYYGLKVNWVIRENVE